MTVNHIRLMVGGHLQMSVFSDFHAHSRPDIPDTIGTCSPKYLSGHIRYDRYNGDLCQCPMTGNHHFSPHPENCLILCGFSARFYHKMDKKQTFTSSQQSLTHLQK